MKLLGAEDIINKEKGGKRNKFFKAFKNKKKLSPEIEFSAAFPDQLQQMSKVAITSLMWFYVFQKFNFLKHYIGIFN